MKKRFITGVVYVIVMAGLLVMKLLIPDVNGIEYGALGVDVLFWAISVCGAFEFTRALGERKRVVDENGETKVTEGISNAQRWVVLVTCALMVPAFVIGKMVDRSGRPGGLGLVLLLAVGSVGAMVAASLTVFDHERSDVKSTAYAELVLLYCGALASVGPNVNHMNDNSDVAIVLLFVLVPMVDVGAFFIGKLFGKLLPLKLAPHTSPNKTVVGGVGGLIGGMLAGVVVWLICKYTSALQLSNISDIPDVVALILISIPTAVMAQLGDLFESAIKRGCGIKDMGKLLPGHGGVLDRFDSMLFASVAIVVCFMVVWVI
ncbi:MAG: phosphatidate cytidylyltransferase [Clostridiales bacterium]|nr:phosphatidate cytidylyltransferase [Clostridiales bacterium]